MTPFDFRPRTRVVFGTGEFARLGEIARELGGTRCLVVADQGIAQAGYAGDALRTLKARRIEVAGFHEFGASPTAATIEAGVAQAKALNPDILVAVGGGSSMDCAKAINFLFTNGGALRDYWGYGKAAKPMLPMVAVPTTAGTGSEAQSFCVISDGKTGTRMAIGDPKAAFRVAILDPKLTVSQPKTLTASTGYDAISHALESLVTTRHTDLSECFSRSAWRLINTGYERVMENPDDLDARGQMLLGAHFGGLAIENSMLGAAHACANPLTARHAVAHGIAIAVLLPHVVKWNEAAIAHKYDDIYQGDLTARLRKLASMAGLPQTLREIGVPEASLPQLAEDAASQWSGRFNPRTFNAAGAMEIYRQAY